MFQLSRRVRVYTDPAQSDLTGCADGSYSDQPSLADFGAFHEVEVTCRGQTDRISGFVTNISVLDAVTRRHAIPLLGPLAMQDRPTSCGGILAAMLAALQPALNQTVTSIRWWLSPYHSVAMEVDSVDRVLISQQFEFAAAHRLHCPDLSDEENRALFGKCNNPSGHGHNYRLEAVVSVPLDSPAATFGLAQLQRIVDETIIERFDHRHLNLDTAEFAQLNPSVEHIAKVCHDLLVEPVSAEGGRLHRVTVWETARTSCTYPARAATL